MRAFWRVYTITTKKFISDGGGLHASALTFYTLFAVVPIVATAFGIAKGFGLESFLDTELTKIFPGQETVVEMISDFAKRLLEQSKGGLIAGIGLILLFYSVFRMLNHTEMAFNRLWNVKQSRSINSKISRYLSLMLIAPILFISSGSIKIFVTTQLKDFNVMLSWSSSLLSLIILVGLFTWAYQYLPNTKVKLEAAFVGGAHTAVFYMLLQSLSVKSQIILSSYGAVYGSLAALPIFLIWVQMGWVILFFGADLCFVYQNKLKNYQESDFNSFSPELKDKLLLTVSRLSIENWSNNHPPLTQNNISKQLNLAPCCVRQILSILTDTGILVETKKTKKTPAGYHPARNIKELSNNIILNAVRQKGYDNLSDKAYKIINKYNS